MAAGIAHELNDPLAAMKIYLGKLQTLHRRDTLSTALLNEIVENLDNLVDKSSHIICHVRDFSRRSSGELHLVDVNEALHSALSMVDQQLRLRDITVHVELSAWPATSLGRRQSVGAGHSEPCQ